MREMNAALAEERPQNIEPACSSECDATGEPLAAPTLSMTVVETPNPHKVDYYLQEILYCRGSLMFVVDYTNM